jgi:hypothetical protein
MFKPLKTFKPPPLFLPHVVGEDVRRGSVPVELLERFEPSRGS